MLPSSTGTSSMVIEGGARVRAGLSVSDDWVCPSSTLAPWGVMMCIYFFNYCILKLPHQDIVGSCHVASGFVEEENYKVTWNGLFGGVKFADLYRFCRNS